MPFLDLNTPANTAEIFKDFMPRVVEEGGLDTSMPSPGGETFTVCGK